MKRALLLSGGAFKGAFQLPVLEALKGNEYDYVCGVSVGAINGAMFAVDKLDVLNKIWSKINTPWPLLGVPGFMAPCVWNWKGAYSLKPMRRKLKKHVKAAQLKTQFQAGIVSRTNKSKYYQLPFNEHSETKDMHLAILASAAMTGIHEPWTINMDGTKHICCDGGHQHPIPEIPWDATVIDVVVNNPIEAPELPSSKVDDLDEAMKWLLEMMHYGLLYSDIERIKHWAQHPANTATVYAPEEHLGGMLDSSKKTIQARIEAGKKALENPLVW